MRRLVHLQWTMLTYAFLLCFWDFIRVSRMSTPWISCDASRLARRGILGRAIAKCGVLLCGRLLTPSRSGPPSRRRNRRTKNRRFIASSSSPRATSKYFILQPSFLLHIYRCYSTIPRPVAWYRALLPIMVLSSVITPCHPLPLLALSFFFPFHFFLHSIYILSCFVVRL